LKKHSKAKVVDLMTEKASKEKKEVPMDVSGSNTAVAEDNFEPVEFIMKDIKKTNKQGADINSLKNDVDREIALQEGILVINDPPLIC
jgi:hypothetical protein